MGHIEMELVELFDAVALREYQQLSLEGLKVLFPEVSWNEIGVFLVEELHA